VKKLPFLLAASALLTSVLMLPAIAEEDSISATVTPQVINVTVSDGSVNYGTLAPGELANTFGTQTQTITNMSNVPVDLMLRSSDADDVSPPVATDWALGPCPSVAEDTFGHQYDIDGNGTFTGVNFPADGTFANANTGILKTLTASGGAEDEAFLELGICMPASITNNVAHHIKVTVTATESSP
jgi:hypothetical protein